MYVCSNYFNGAADLKKHVEVEHELSINLDKLNNEDEELAWGGIPYRTFVAKTTEIYNEIVHYRRNLFKVPSGKAGKEYIMELTYWLHQFNASTKLNGIALKVFIILPSLLLQKPSARSKAKDHTNAHEQRLTL